MDTVLIAGYYYRLLPVKWHYLWVCVALEKVKVFVPFSVSCLFHPDAFDCDTEPQWCPRSECCDRSEQTHNTILKSRRTCYLYEMNIFLMGTMKNYRTNLIIMKRNIQMRVKWDMFHNWQSGSINVCFWQFPVNVWLLSDLLFSFVCFDTATIL